LRSAPSAATQPLQANAHRSNLKSDLFGAPPYAADLV